MMKVPNRLSITSADLDQGRICYNPVEKECLALVFAIKKIQHYLVGQTIHIISRVNLLQIIMTKPSSLNSRIANWAILLFQYDMTFIPQKATKAQALADFLTAHPVPETSKLHEDIPRRGHGTQYDYD